MLNHFFFFAFNDIIYIGEDMKRLFTLILCATIIGGTFYKRDYLTDKIMEYFQTTPLVQMENKNKYSKEHSYEFVKITDDFVPYNYQELLNIFYTVLDSGYDTFTFYCPVEYEDCINDVKKISDPDNIEVLTTIGNYISPFNNFFTLNVKYDTAGEITIDVNKLYSDEDIAEVNQKLDIIWNDIVKQDMNEEDIIYAFHDYIINNTKYDESYEAELEKGTPTHKANKANGPLFDGYAICSGYTDVMALILDRLNIPNFKVASNTHVWNAVYLNDKWLHLDLTWDDPVDVNHQKDNLLHKFFLIDTASLEEFDIEDHTFNKANYLEFK